jgi:hypothetical protein
MSQYTQVRNINMGTLEEVKYLKLNIDLEGTVTITI